MGTICTWLQIPAGPIVKAHLGCGVYFVHVAQDGVVLWGGKRHWGWKGVAMAVQAGFTKTSHLQST